MTDAIAYPVAAAPADGPDVSAVIEGELRCVRCGYCLRGLSGEGRCPECGLAILSSLRNEAVLSLSDISWIESLRAGMTLLIFGFVLWGAPLFLCAQLAGTSEAVSASIFCMTGPRPGLFLAGWNSGIPVDQRVGWVVVAGTAAAVGLFFLGVWRLTAQEPAVSGFEPSASTRRVLRALSLGLLLACLASPIVADPLDAFARSLPAGVRSLLPSSRPQWVWAYVAAVALADAAAGAALYRMLRTLARRVLDRALERETRILQFTTTAGMLLIAADAAFVGWGLLWRFFSGLAFAGGCILLLSGFGTILLFLSHRQAFARAAAAARAGEQIAYAETVRRAAIARTSE